VTPEDHDRILLTLEAAQRNVERDTLTAERTYRLALGQRRRGGVWQHLDGTPASLVLDDSPACRIYTSALDRLQAAQDAVVAHERQYTGWQRWRLVISSDGQVHADERCRSFRPTTRTVIIPSLSGRSADDAVSLLGNACCSVCVPSRAGTSRIPAALVGILVRQGTTAFEAALARRRSR
jgi:hypothetical protein